MKKLLSLLMAVVVSASIFGAVNAKENQVQMLAAYSQKPSSQNTLWVGTFQLVWNEFQDNIVKGPIKFKNYKSELADILNKQEFKKSMLSDESYYVTYGETNIELKKRIENAIMEKFNEKSELLDKIDWNHPNNAYLFYAMLVKNFDFDTRFDNLKTEKFGKDKEPVNYFGISKTSRPALYKGVRVLFYNNPFDYAVALTSDKDEVFLYRTNSNKRYDELYKTLEKKSSKYKGAKSFVEGDLLKVPYMSIKQETSYDELCGKEILNTNRLYIDKALQTVDFNMNNKGVKLKSEAVMNIMFMSAPIEIKERGRNFFFNDTFVLFMKEKDKSNPYFAVRVKNMDDFKYKGEIK